MIITVGSKIADNKGNSYVLDETLGSGGFGNVYKAHRENDGKIVAVKIIQNTFNDNDAFLSFQKETNLSKLVESENVIKYLYIHDGTEFAEYPPYIIMEYTSGGTLRDLIDNRNGEQFDIVTLKSIYYQLANGMKCISKHLVHRDIKPENILNFDGVLKITDFGLSKISGDSTKTMTFKNSGTLPYIAPEAWNNDSNTIQMDIYSMGIVFYELATLSYPYTIPRKLDNMNFRDMHLYSSIIDPTTKNPVLSPNIISMIIKMLEKPTQKRFKDWDEIISVLDSKSLPIDDISEIVNNAVSLRNKKDIEQQKEQAAKKKEKEDKENYIKLSYSQYVNVVINPIRTFVERFNSQYSNTQKINIIELAPSDINYKFTTKIILTSGNKVFITGEILFKERFTRTVPGLFGSQQIINYLPKCKGKDIVLWCQVEDNENCGFNILLLKNDSGIYGDWFILENTTNGFSLNKRPSPFGFSLSELPEQIDLIYATHIYDMNLTTFSIEKVLDFISNRV